MFWTMLAALFAGLGGAGIGMGLRKLSGNRLPKWVTPVSAGAMMFLATISTEYAWYPNVLRSLPQDTIVITERTQQAVYQPWTYIRPWVRGFIAFAPSETVEVTPESGVYAVQVNLFERWQPGMVRPVLVDCPGAARFDLDPDTAIGAQGRPEGQRPTATGIDDPIIQTVCAAQGG